MGSASTACKIGIALLSLCLAAPVFAAAEPLKPFNLTGRYNIAWSGITLGRIILTVREDGASYAMSVDTKTRGIGAMISDEKRIVSAEGTKNEAADYIPVRYHSAPQKKAEGDIVTLTYDAKGDIAKRERKDPDDPSWRPLPSNEEINTARDPITAAFILRQKLYSQRDTADTNVVTRSYDGLRLAEMRFIRTLNAKVEVMGHYVDTVRVAVKRAPINGYTAKELKKYKKGDPEIHVYFSNDADFLPVRATARAGIGELSMTLIEKY